MNIAQNRSDQNVIHASKSSEPIEVVSPVFRRKMLSARSAAVRHAETRNVIATGYCPGTPGSGCPVDSKGRSVCTGYATGLTALGTPARAGNGTITNPHIIAVDPDYIPLGTLVYIQGWGYARAEDTGSAIKGNRIDLLFNYHKQAKEFGVQELKLTIIRWGKEQ